MHLLEVVKGQRGWRNRLPDVPRTCIILSKKISYRWCQFVICKIMVRQPEYLLRIDFTEGWKFICSWMRCFSRKKLPLWICFWLCLNCYVRVLFLSDDLLCLRDRKYPTCVRLHHSDLFIDFSQIFPLFLLLLNLFLMIDHMKGRLEDSWSCLLDTDFTVNLAIVLLGSLPRESPLTSVWRLLRTGDNEWLIWKNANIFRLLLTLM